MQPTDSVHDRAACLRTLAHAEGLAGLVRLCHDAAGRGLGAPGEIVNSRSSRALAGRCRHTVGLHCIDQPGLDPVLPTRGRAVSIRSAAASILVAALVAVYAPGAFAQAGGNRIRGEVPAIQAGEFIGKEATVCGMVDGARFAENAEGQPTYLFMGGNFPAHKFSARIWGRDRAAFDVPPETLTGKVVCVTGDIRTANGRPEIVVRGARNLKVK